VNRDDVKKVVRATLALLSRMAKRTRTPADDLMAAMLQANEERLVDAVVDLLAQTGERPTDEQVVQALEKVGIRV
jgi:hypothetical protein